MSTSIQGVAPTRSVWPGAAIEPTAAERDFLEEFEVAMRFGPAGVEMKSLARASRADAPPPEPPPRWSSIAPAAVLVPATALVPTEFSPKYVAQALRAYETAARWSGVG